MEQNYSKDMIHNLSRLEWACRRGMLELDVLLGKFLKKAYPGLSEEEKLQFVRLLGCPDPDLFDWLMGHDVPADEGLAKIVELVRRNAIS
jgi:antitoxin CptB